jgi:RNA polymerase sigma-70 factor (ECF subfamily)
MWTSKNHKRKDFEKAALEHLDTLYGVALRLTRNQQNAEDLVQDTFVRALRFYDSFEWGTNIRAWLLRILTNTFINTYRRGQKERQVAESPEHALTHESLMSAQSMGHLRDPESQAMAGLVRRELEAAVAELPDDFRMVVVLADVHGFSYREIAEIQGCPIGTVMSRLHRARKALQRRLMEQAQAAGIVEPEDDATSRAGLPSPTSLDDFRQRRRGVS